MRLSTSWDNIIGDSWLMGLMSVWNAAKDVRLLREGTKYEQGKQEVESREDS